MTIGVSVETTLASAVATAGTFTVAYPAGFTRASFIKAPVAKLSALQRIWSSPNDFGLTLGASSITVTWRAAQTLPVGTKVRLEINAPGAKPSDYADFSGVLKQITRSNPIKTRHVTLGNPVVASTTALRAAATIAGAGAVTLLAAGQTFDVPRNVTVTGAGDVSSVVFTILGLDEYGQTVTETITGVNTNTVAGKKAFKSITSITASGACATNVSFGFGNVLGLPVFLPSAGYILKELEDGAAAIAGTTVAGLDPQTKSTATTADVRGTYVPNSTPDGSKSFVLILALDDPDFVGVPQFAG